MIPARVAVERSGSTAMAHKCQICGTTDHWHWHGCTVGEKYYSDVCDDCYRGLPRKRAGSALSEEQRLQRNLPKGSILGPKVNGIRGIYRPNKLRRRR